jgi:hypothetical protein
MPVEFLSIELVEERGRAAAELSAGEGNSLGGVDD